MCWIGRGFREKRKCMYAVIIAIVINNNYTYIVTMLSDFSCFFSSSFMTILNNR